MNWEIKEIDTKNDFNELEKFFKEKFTNIYNTKLSSKYLYWKLKQNKSFNGVMAVGKKDQKIIGTASLTFKKIRFKGDKIYIAEIGDTYVDFTAQKSLIVKKKLQNQSNFENLSIFESLVKHMIKISKTKNIKFIYGLPNDMSIKSYKRRLNFKIIECGLYGYVLPCFKTSSKIINSLNYILKLYRLFLCKTNYNKLSFTIEKEISSKDLDFFLKHKNNNYHLDKNEEYFNEKYKNNPEGNFKFCKIYEYSNLIGIFVLKEDLLAKKINIVDCLSLMSVKYLTKYVLLALNIKYNLSVNFWEKNKNFNLFTRFIYTIFRRKKIKIICYNDLNSDQYTFFNEFYLGSSDNF